MSRTPLASLVASRSSALAVVLVLLALMHASACATEALSAADGARVARAIATDRARYPELDGREIAVSALYDDAVFFQANFTLGSALSDGPLAYAIQANPRALSGAVDDDALAGVLGHELAHLRDYQSRTRAQLVELIAPALLPTSSTWERGTDLVAIARGFGPGLLRFRVWSFRVLARDDVATKRAVYYSPLEIALLLDVKTRCPALFAGFLASPPTTARAIATHCP